MSAMSATSTCPQARQGCIYLIGCLYRPGALRFATSLESVYFPPDTDANDDYNIYQINYCNLPHYIIEVPCDCYEKAVKLATMYNLKLVNGKPNNPAADEFRLSCAGDQCFTLETLDMSLLPADLHEVLSAELGARQQGS